MMTLEDAYHIHYDWVRKYLIRHLQKGQLNDLDDLIVQTFSYLATWIKKHPDIDDDIVRTHLFVLARDVVMTYWKSCSRSYSRVVVCCLEDGKPVEHEFFLKEDPYLKNAAIIETVRAAITHLTPAQRDAYEQVELGNMPLNDYAKRNGISYQAVQARLHDAREVIRERLEKDLCKRPPWLYLECAEGDSRPCM